MKKQFGLFAIFLLVLSSFTGIVSSAPTPVDPGTEPLEITKVKVEGINAGNISNSKIDVERGNSVYIEVFFKGAIDGNIQGDYEIQDVRLKAWIEGYEDDIEASTGTFDVEEGVSYRKVLRLDLPTDMDSNEDYNLYVRLSNGDYDDEVVYSRLLRIQEQDENLVIRDVLFDPGLNVNAGETLFTRVRVENMGDNTERDIKVKVSIPALGLQAATYLDDLVTQHNDDNGDDNKEDFNSAELTERLGLTLPSNAAAGQYDLFIEVDYNRGRDSTEKMYTITVSGIDSSSLVVSALDTEKTVSTGDGVAYEVALTNLGDLATFTFDVENVASWGTARVDPGYITLSEDGTGTVFVYVAASENAQAGSHDFNLVVKSGENVVKKVPLTANVQAGFGAATGFRQGLEIGFAILLVILVILGIIIAARRLGKDGNMEEPLLEEDQTYY